MKYLALLILPLVLVGCSDQAQQTVADAAANRIETADVKNSDTANQVPVVEKIDTEVIPVPVEVKPVEPIVAAPVEPAAVPVVVIPAVPVVAAPVEPVPDEEVMVEVPPVVVVVPKPEVIPPIVVEPIVVERKLLPYSTYACWIRNPQFQIKVEYHKYEDGLRHFKVFLFERGVEIDSFNFDEVAEKGTYNFPLRPAFARLNDRRAYELSIWLPGTFQVYISPGNYQTVAYGMKFGENYTVNAGTQWEMNSFQRLLKSDPMTCGF